MQESGARPVEKYSTLEPATEEEARAHGLTTVFFEHAKDMYLGRVPQEEAAHLFLTSSARAYVLTGSIFQDHSMPTNKQNAIGVRLIARCVDAVGVVTLRGWWQAYRCASCGESPGTYRNWCETCGAPWSPECDNPYRHWFLQWTLWVRGCGEAWTWNTRARHDREWCIVAWQDDLFGTPWKSYPGRIRDSYWHLKKWMRAHVVLNYPRIQKFLGRTPTPRSLEASRQVARRGSWSGFKFLYADPAKLRQSLHAINLSALQGTPADDQSEADAPLCTVAPGFADGVAEDLARHESQHPDDQAKAPEQQGEIGGPGDR